jgi:hypothetical protein
MAGNTLPIVHFEKPITHTEIDGIEMGVLPGGTPYLTARALALICGQAPGVIAKLVKEWTHERRKPRGRVIADLLAAQGHADETLCTRVDVDGAPVLVIPDAVCMAILEYYAFEASTRSRFVAQQSYRLLARQSLQRFIYGRVGYDPDAEVTRTWKHLHDRMVLNPTPPGYFGLLRELADILIAAVQSGLALGPRTLPDVSVGLLWSKHWVASDLDAVFGERRKHPHRFPESFPQLDVVEAWIYPIAALAEFRAWMRASYLPSRFPRYLAGKVRCGALPPYRIDNLLATLAPAS